MYIFLSCRFCFIAADSFEFFAITLRNGFAKIAPRTTISLFGLLPKKLCSVRHLPGLFIYNEKILKLAIIRKYLNLVKINREGWQPLAKVLKIVYKKCFKQNLHVYIPLSNIASL